LNVKNDQDVEDFVSKVQSYVVNGNKEQLAEEVVYPKYKQVISDAYTKYLFVNWQGIMFGEGLCIFGLMR
jgi:hypothetical protein